MRGANLAFGGLLALGLALVILFLALPVLSIFVEAGPGDLLRSLAEPATREALWLSLKASAIAVLVVTLGWGSSRLPASHAHLPRPRGAHRADRASARPSSRRGRDWAAGCLWPRRAARGLLEDAGARLVFETAGVVVALAFVAAPFFVSQAYAAFSAVDRSLVEASRTLGASEAATFVRVRPAELGARARVGACPRVGTGPRRVRRDAHLRRIARRRNPHRAARNLRLPRHRPRRRARACRGARGSLGRVAARA